MTRITKNTSKVFFANSGSEANDSLIKLVWYFNNAKGRTQKKKIILRLRGYHGVTVASGSLTGLPHVQRDFDLPIANILHTDCPHYYRGAEEGELEEEFTARMADNLEKLIQAEGPDTIAFCQPLIITESEIEEMFDRFAKALEETEAWVQDNNLREAS